MYSVRPTLSIVEPTTDIHVLAVHWIEHYAARKRYSINRLADFAGISRSYMSTILRQKNSPSLRTLQKIADALDVEVRDLLEPTHE